MKILFIGGTGIISTACAQLAVARGIDVTLLNRSKRPGIAGTKQLTVDLDDGAAAKAALANTTWDVVLDFIAFTTDHVQQRIGLFDGRVGQYIFISSASAYQKPLSHYLVNESTPLANPYWEYSRNKIACEELLMHQYRKTGYPVTIIRPSFTYDHTVVPLAVNSWLKGYTAVDRMRRGLPVIVPGDGLTLWTNTHNSDFAKALIGLLGHQGALGQPFNITSDEVLTWDQIYQAVASAAGVAKPNLVHIASDFITACLPDEIGALLGDKSYSVVIDNSKIKRFVPDFVATTRFKDGIAKTIAWYDADPKRQQIDHAANADWDRLIAAYQRGLDAAKREFGR